MKNMEKPSKNTILDGFFMLKQYHSVIVDNL
ncbi:hypothetical protein HNP72_001771 [Sphingobacterium soli]|nr:hypothetical protein [Sphingobacterium soli]